MRRKQGYHGSDGKEQTYVECSRGTLLCLKLDLGYFKRLWECAKLITDCRGKGKGRERGASL